MNTRQAKKLVREGKYAAEVSVELMEDETSRSPYLSAADMKKLDRVRRGEVAEAAKEARVFELLPLAG